MMESESGVLGKKRNSLPPGFRFYPTDEVLFMYYLKRKVLGKTLKPEMIAEVDVYKFAPWDLPPMASLNTRDLNWFFFCPRSKKYPSGGRANRATEYGYWKSTGNDRTVMYNSRAIGKIKTLIFHRGKAPKGERTDWVMHEYRLEDKVLADKGVSQDAFVICKIYEKSGLGPRNGETYGARFVEEEWDSDVDDENVQEGDFGVVVQELGCGSLAGSNGTTAASVGTTNVTTASVDAPSLDSATGLLAASLGSPGTAVAVTAAGASTEDEVDRLLSYLTEETDDVAHIYNGLGDLVDLSNPIDIDWGDCFLELDDIN